MSFESQEPASDGLSSTERLKLSPEVFLQELNTFLGDTFMGLALNQIQLDTDPEGHIEPLVIDNLKTMLKVGARMAPDETVQIKFENMKAFLAPY